MRGETGTLQANYMKRIPGGAGELADTRVGATFVDFTNTSLFPQGSIGSTVIELHGDWLYCDTSSVGAVECDLDKNFDDSMAVTLAPGRVFRRKFDQIRIFSSGASLPPTIPGVSVLPNPGLSLFYGEGPCPFDSCDFEQSKQPIPYQCNIVGGAPGLSQSNAISIPQGASITCSMAATQTTLGTETSILRCWLSFTVAGGAYKVAPDFSTQDDITTAAVGTSNVQARWTKVKAPLGATAVQIQVVNIGTAATNNIVQMASAANLLLEVG